MASYEREYSNFPERKITLHHFKNVDDNISELVNQINQLRKQGLYGQAQRIIENNADILSNRDVDAEFINTLIEEIYNTQVYARQVQQSIYDSPDEPDCNTYDVWIGGE